MWTCGLMMPSCINLPFRRLSKSRRQVGYVLLTRAPVADRGIATSSLPLDLHVLGLSLAFILSQDQTLRCIFSFSLLYLRSVTWPNWLLSLLFYCTTLASSIPSMNLAKIPRSVPRFLFCGCKVNSFSLFAPNIFPTFLCCITWKLYNILIFN